MGQVVPFAFEDRLVRTVVQDDEPWFVGKDVCSVLDIVKHHQALDRLDDDERGTCSVGTPSGEQEMIIISEPGVYRLVFTSRKPEAERFKRWLAHEVLPELRRRGFYGRAPEPEPLPAADTVAMLQAKIAMINAACRCKGNAYASRLWDELGLPTVPAEPAIDPAREAAPGALALLRRFLAVTIEGTMVAPIGETIEVALDGSAEDAAALAACGILVDCGDEAGFLLHHGMPEMIDLFASIDGGEWWRLLRSLPGNGPGPRRRVDGRQSRTTFVSAKWLEPAAARA